MQTLPWHKTDKLVVLTGAGISAESGIKTFRDNNGLWETHRVEDVATPEAFARDPRLVWRFYDARRKQLPQAQPNSAHLALVELEQKLGPDRFLLITQNVDDLHERAGSQHLLHMHGELLKVRCTGCHTVEHTDTDMLPDLDSPLPLCCACGAMLRPHIVWFGEMPFDMPRIEQALKECTYFVAIGTSGVVYPAAGFLYQAKLWGATTIGFNLEAPENHHLFDQFYPGKAGEQLPQWVNQISLS